MAEKNDGADKTEEPTPKRLSDARKKGDVPKSKELTSTVTLTVWWLLAISALPAGAHRLSALLQLSIDSLQRPFALAAPALGWAALEASLVLVAMLVLPVMLVGLLTEFLQAGPVLALQKVAPRLDNLNPVAGIQKMFSKDNLLEVMKAAAKTAALAGVGWLVVGALMPQIVLLSISPVAHIGTAMWELTFKLLAWTLGLFAAVSALDLVWQHKRHLKKNRMSMQDIKKESKENDGDPMIKQQRRQLAHEWSSQAASLSAAGANVLVVNPTHVAIAIDYNRERCPVPVLAAKGEDDIARDMRAAAEKAGVPIVRNIPLARDMLARAEVGELVPQDLFEVIAEVILWAKQVREDVARHDTERDAVGGEAEAPPSDAAPKRRRTVPGEDLTRYPDSFEPATPPATPRHPDR